MPIPVGERVAWLDADDETLRGMAALFGAKASPLPPSPAMSGAPLMFPWEEQTHPDFTASQEIYLPPQPFYQNGKFRRLLLVLLLLGLVSAGWWLFSNAPERPGFLWAGDPAQKAVITSSAATPSTNDEGKNGGSGAIIGGPEATPTSGTGVGGAIASTATYAAEATLTDLERIAETATALFANATMVTECVAPSSWVSYIIEKGDTIEGLARSRGVQREMLIVANCLAQSNLEVGRVIFLPPVRAVVDETVEPTLTPTVAIWAGPTQSPIIFPTAAPIQFPTPTAVVIIFPTVPPTAVPPTAVPPTSVPPTDVPTQAPPQPTPIPTAAATAMPPPPPPEPTSASPTGEP